MNEKLKILIPIAVEGKYDKIKVSSIADAQIITTDGFGVFAKEDKKLLIRRLAEPRGLIVLTDSDGAGLVIRNYFRSILPKEKLYHLYTPQIEGREKRKKEPSKAGFLGVEGIEADTLRALLAPFAVPENGENNETNSVLSTREVTKADFYADGLSGGEGSAAKRGRLAESLGLPPDLSANALLAAVNLLAGYERYRELIDHVDKNS